MNSLDSQELINQMLNTKINELAPRFIHSLDTWKLELYYDYPNYYTQKVYRFRKANAMDITAVNLNIMYEAMRVPILRSLGPKN